MQPNVPIPTDNIYKFQATFGLVLIIAAIFSAAFVQVGTNGKIYEYFKDYASLKVSTPESEDFRRHITKQAEVLGSDKTVAMYLVGAIIGIGGMISVAGFRGWHKVQAQQDELLDLQIAKARKEAHGSNVYRELPKRPEAKKPAKKAR